MTRDCHPLRVAARTAEIGGAATSVTFDVPPALAQTFRWTAGQHLTLRFDLNGQEERRSYTISNPPGAALRITVKRVTGGRVSNHIGDGLKPGDVVDVMPPFGGFTLLPGAMARRTHYFFGAGSGITPLFAMIRDVLDREPCSVAHLVYGNTDEHSILFRAELDALQQAHSDRFTLRHVLSAPSFWSRVSPWRTGRLCAETVAAAIAETPPEAQDVQYWICGPGSMNTDLKAALTDLDVPAPRIHMESFGGAVAPDDSVTGIAARAKVTLDGRSVQIPVAKGQTLLEATRAVGLTPRFSCQSGVCGACRARLHSGEVHMRARMALEDSDIAKGDILTCQSVAKTPHLELVFASAP